MKIVELGHSGVGKTTYMASMYAALQRKIEGFSLRAIDTDEHTRLCALAENIKIGVYPPRTSQRSDYNFYLQYQGKNVLSFFWADYRGKAIGEKTKDSYEFRALQQDISQADGIIIFFDCNTLAEGDTRTNELRRITALISHTLTGLDHPISLAIVFTKIDLVKKFNVELLEPIKELIEVIEKSDLVSGALIPIACGQKNINVQMPLLYALQAGIHFKINSLKKQMEHHKEQIRHHEYIANKHGSKASEYQDKSNGIGGQVRDWWRKNIQELPTYVDLTNQEQNLAKKAWEEAKCEKEKTEEKLKEYEPLIQPAYALNSYLKKLPHIEQGKNLKQYLKQMSRFKPGFFRKLFAWFLP
ncbi:MAG: hypothetical protein ACFKPT_10505 [Gloeotrichia echinulata GP01]